ncbi:cytochrome P450 [Streptomyces sp. NPDC046215]|uniref:Cytochrome P450 n=1 Tax=Streptomyces stramineus TaxID=173861 RepID=A0ABP3KQB7_9ACTN
MLTTFSSGTVPGALPFVGHTPQLLRRPIPFLASLPDIGGLVEIKLERRRVFGPCRPGLPHLILADDRTFNKGGGPAFEFAEILEERLAGCTHEHHRRQRRLVQQVSRPAQVERYGPVVEEETVALMETWQGGQEFDLFPVLLDFTARVVTRMLFSSRADPTASDQVQRLFASMMSQGDTGWRTGPSRVLQRVTRLGARERYRIAADFQDTLDRAVSGYPRTGRGDVDMMSALALDRNGDSGLSRGELRSQAVTMLAAGAHSPATTLTWAFYLLSQRPESEGRLRDEADSVLGGRPARWGDLPSLRFTERGLMETLRLYPPVWIFFRKTSVEVPLINGCIPRRLRDDQPLDDAPARRRVRRPWGLRPRPMAPGRCTAAARRAFTAFGDGPRRCIGEAFGLAQLTLVLASITGQWRLASVPDARILPHARAVNVPPRYLPVRLSRRHRKS